MYTRILLSIGLTVGLISCGNDSKSSSPEKKETKTEALDCWMGAVQATCDMAESYNTAKKLVLEFKRPAVRSGFGYKEALAYNDSIFNLLTPLNRDLSKIKTIIGDDKYNLYFGDIEKQKEHNKIYREKLDVINKLKVSSDLKPFNSKYQDRDVAYTIENKSNKKLDRIDVIQTFYDKNKTILYVDEGGTIGSYDLVPNTGGDFIPANYKGKKSDPILSISDVKTLKAIHAVETKIIDVIFK